MDFPILPRVLSEMTGRQEVKTVDYLAAKAMGRLRRMQRIVQAQIPQASKAENTLALSNLQMMDDLIAAAIWKKTEL